MPLGAAVRMIRHPPSVSPVDAGRTGILAGPIPREVLVDARAGGRITWTSTPRRPAATSASASGGVGTAYWFVISTSDCSNFTLQMPQQK